MHKNKQKADSYIIKVWYINLKKDAQSLRYIADANDHNLAINKHIFTNIRMVILEFTLLTCLMLACIWFQLIRHNQIKVKDIFQVN